MRIKFKNKIITANRPDIAISLDEAFSQYFLSQGFKLKKNSDTLVAERKKSLIELWLPDSSERNFSMFRLIIDLKAPQEYLVIMNKVDPGWQRENNDELPFKLVQQAKKNCLSQSVYPKFRNFEDLLDYAMKEASNPASQVSYDASLNEDYPEEGIFIKKTGMESGISFS
jgi:hypothetical protein